MEKKTYKDLQEIKCCLEERLSGEQAVAFFENNYTEIKYTIVGYKFLKEIYNMPTTHRIAEDYYFKRIFESFYALLKQYLGDYPNRLYNKMDDIRDKGIGKLTPQEVSNMANTLSGNDGFQFSFTTKMLNLEDDEYYPIYDRMVALVFGFPINCLGYKKYKENSEKEKLYAEWYDHIKNVYEKLENEPVVIDIVNKFKTIFDCDLHYMRIIDIIFWQLGKAIDKKRYPFDN